VLPIAARTNEKDSERVVVGFASEMSKVFNTKTRAPYMVPLQTVLLSEVKQRLKIMEAPNIRDEEIKQAFSQSEDYKILSSLLPSGAIHKVSSDQLIFEEEPDFLDPSKVQEILRRHSVRQPRKTIRNKSHDSDWEKISCDDLHPLEGIMEELPFKESWEELEERHKQDPSCLFSEYLSFKLVPVIAKANDDLRQEILAM